MRSLAGSGDPKRNIEIKARCGSLDRAREIARALGAREAGALIQRDTYFRLECGANKGHRPARLKLRDFGSGEAELIFYQRAGGTGPRPSDYRVVRVADPAGERALLEAALGVRVEVRKARELWLLDNVRIHLDRVEGLGDFLEFEAVVDGAHPEAECRAETQRLLTAFGIAEADLLRESYSDLAGA